MGKNDTQRRPSFGNTIQPAQATVINDDTWEAFIFMVIPAEAPPSSTDKANPQFAKVNSLADVINNGSRQRFSTIQKAELISWVVS